MNCCNCKNRNTVQGYKEVLIGSRHNRTVKEWCKECLTKYANTSIKYNDGYMPKLRSTNIKEYLEVIADFNFIPYAEKQKISYK